MIGLGAVVVPSTSTHCGLPVEGRGHRPRVQAAQERCRLVHPGSFFAIALGWIFTEMGRQPFVVVPNLEGDPAIRLYTASYLPGVSGEEILFSCSPWACSTAC